MRDDDQRVDDDYLGMTTKDKVEKFQLDDDFDYDNCSGPLLTALVRHPQTNSVCHRSNTPVDWFIKKRCFTSCWGLGIVIVRNYQGYLVNNLVNHGMGRAIFDGVRIHWNWKFTETNSQMESKWIDLCTAQFYPEKHPEKCTW